jgi:hypothetical protein
MDLNSVFDRILLGFELEAHGEKWIGLKRLTDRLVLVIKAGDNLPATVHLVRETKKEVTSDES